WVLEALRGLGVDAVYKPINDISSDQGKIGGAAQTRRAGAVLHHVTMAYDIDAAKMLEVLRIGREKLSDKGSVSANKRVTPLRQQTDLPRETIIDALAGTFDRKNGLPPSRLTDAELEAAERLRRGKLDTDEWRDLLPGGRTGPRPHDRPARAPRPRAGPRSEPASSPRPGPASRPRGRSGSAPLPGPDPGPSGGPHRRGRRQVVKRAPPRSSVVPM